MKMKWDGLGFGETVVLGPWSEKAMKRVMCAAKKSDMELDVRACGGDIFVTRMIGSDLKRMISLIVSDVDRLNNRMLELRKLGGTVHPAIVDGKVVV